MLAPMRKVLLVEEDATYAGELHRGLARLGFDVVLVRDGSAGLARAVSERFDFLLISAELPSTNGFRLCNRVRKDPNFGDVPLFLMGNVDEELAMHQRLPTRADEYFKKPVVFAELLARIRLRRLIDEDDDDGEHTDVTDARVSLAAVAELQQKLVEQEQTIATLNRDLATARAKANNYDAQGKELERTRTALATAERLARTASVRPPPNTAATFSDKASVDATLALSKKLETEKTNADALRAKLAASDAELRTLSSRVRDAERTIATYKKKLDGSLADKEHALKRIEDMNAQLARGRSDLERLREEVAATKSLVASERAGAQRAFEGERDGWTSARAELEQALREARARIADEVATTHALETKSGERLAEQRAELTAVKQACEAQLASLREELETARAGASREEARARELEQRLSSEAAARADAAVAADKALEEARASMSTTHVRVLADVRADLELAKTAAQEASKTEAQSHAERSALRKQLEEQTSSRTAAEERAAQLQQLVTKHEQRLADLDERLVAEAKRSLEAERVRDDARGRVEAIERVWRELEEAHAAESLTRATAHEAAVSALRERLLAAEAANEAIQGHAEARRRLDLAEADAAWEERLAAAVAEAKRGLTVQHDAEIETLLDRFMSAERDRIDIQAAFDRGLQELESSLERTRAQLEAEREQYAAARAQSAKKLAALDGVVASRNHTVKALEQEAESMRGELAALEAEILGLRSDLVSVRRERDVHILGARAAGAELERHADVLARAEKILDDAGSKDSET